MFLNSRKYRLIQIKKPDQQTGSRNRGGGAVSKAELAGLVLVPSGAVFLRGGSGLSNPLTFISKQEVKHHNVISIMISGPNFGHFS